MFFLKMYKGSKQVLSIHALASNDILADSQVDKACVN